MGRNSRLLYTLLQEQGRKGLKLEWFLYFWGRVDLTLKHNQAQKFESIQMATDYHQVLLKPFQKYIIRTTPYEQRQAIRSVSQYVYKTSTVYVSDSRAESYFF